MSIPLVQNNDKDAINTSIIAIKRNIERINMLLGLSNSEEIDTSEFVKKSDIVDEVAIDNMHSVTSNAVAVAIDNLTDSLFKNNSDSVGDRANSSLRASTILTILQQNPDITSFTISYNGGYRYGYFTNRKTSNQEVCVLEMNPYEAQLSIFYVDNRITSCRLQRTI